MSIKKTLIASVLGLLLVTVSSILLSTYFSTQEVLLGHARQVMENVALDTIARSEDFLKPAQAAAGLTQRLANHNVVSREKPEKLERYFFEQLKLYPHFAGIYFGATNGDFIFVKRDNSMVPDGFRSKFITQKPEGRNVAVIFRDSKFERVAGRLEPKDEYDPRTRPWYGKAVAEKGLIWTDPYIFFTAQQPGITTASPVYMGEGEEHLSGVIGVDIEISEISNFLARLKLGQGGSAFILNHNGDVIAHPDVEKIKKTEVKDAQGKASIQFSNIDSIDDPVSRAAYQALSQKAKESPPQSQILTSFEHNQIPYQASLTPFRSAQWRWSIVIYVPEEDYLGVFHRNQQRNILFACVIGLVASLLGFWLARGITLPISLIGQQALQLKQGKYDLKGKVKSAYREINDMSDAFFTMLTSVKEHNVLLEQKVEERTRELDQSLTQIKAAHHLISESIEYASMIQKSLLPDPQEIKRLLPQSLVLWQPRDVVSGDIYFIAPAERGVLVALADCTGHGVPGALLTMIAITGLREICLNRGIMNPAQVMAKLNRFVRANLLHETKEASIMSGGLDAGICLIDRVDGKLYFSGANLNLVHLGEQGCQVIKGEKQSLGYFRSNPEHPFQNHVVPLKGQSFFLYTDGITDQPGGPRGLPLGKSQFMKILEETARLPMAARAGVLLEAINLYRDNQEQRDDFTLVGFSE